MPQNWKTYKLSEVFDIIGGGTPKTTIEEYWNGDIPWLSVVDFNNDQRTVHHTEKTITELGLQKSSTKLLKKGQLIISARGTVGQLAQLGRDMTFNQSCYGLTGKNDILNNDYGYYLLKHSVSNIQANAHGSVFDTITRNTFENIEVSVPPLQEQIAIASILIDLDDKIENNLQMNKTLEEMALALYKHWFVDFGPFQNGEFVDSELGMIPKGWEVKCLEELLLVKPMNGLYKKKEFQGFGSRWLKMKSVYGLDIITNQDMELISVTSKEIDKFGCLYDDLVFGRTSLVLEGIGKCAIIKSKDDTLIFESNLFRIRPDKNKIDSNILFLFFKSEKGREEVRKLARQTAAVSITSKDLIGIKIPCPTMEVQESTAKALDNYILKIISNLKENQILTTLRDNLLPKLISGEVRVKDIEQTITQVL